MNNNFIFKKKYFFLQIKFNLKTHTHTRNLFPQKIFLKKTKEEGKRKKEKEKEKKRKKKEKKMNYMEIPLPIDPLIRAEQYPDCPSINLATFTLNQKLFVVRLVNPKVSLLTSWGVMIDRGHEMSMTKTMAGIEIRLVDNFKLGSTSENRVTTLEPQWWPEEDRDNVVLCRPITTLKTQRQSLDMIDTYLTPIVGPNALDHQIFWVNLCHTLCRLCNP